jgi:hypothetical protein
MSKVKPWIILLLLAIFALACQRATLTTAVYITDTGIRYHRANCTSLRYSKTEMPLGLAIQEGYTPCKICKPPVLKGDDKD